MGRITGIGRFVRDLGRKLEEKGIQSFVITPFESEDDGSDRYSVRLRLHTLRNVELSIRTLARLVSLRHRIDIVHAQQSHSQSLTALVASRALGKPSVLTLHLMVPPPRNWLLRRVGELTNRLATACASAAVAVSLPVAQNFGLAKSRVIENGVDTDVFRPSESDRQAVRITLGIQGGTVFVFAGRWARSKGVDLLLRACDSDLLKDKAFHLVICGAKARDEPDLLDSSLPEARNRESIRILGEVENLPRYLRAGDIFVLPSRFEGMPLAFLEAMATGLPVIASDIPVHRQIAEVAGCVWTFRAGDADDLARVMRQVLDEGIPKEWPKRARDAALRHYSLDRMLQTYLDLYRELVVSGSTT